MNQNREDAEIKDFDNPSAFIEDSNTRDDIYNNIHGNNPKRKRRILIVFDDTIVDIMTNKKLQTIINDLFFICKKSDISLVFITQSYFIVPKDVRLISTHYLIIKIHSRKNFKILLIIQLILTTKTF